MKKTVTIELDHSELDGPMDDAIAYLEKIKADNAPFALTIELDKDYDNSITFTATYEREETMAEVTERETHDVRVKQWRDKSDRDTLARLKKKFGEA